MARLPPLRRVGGLSCGSCWTMEAEGTAVATTTGPDLDLLRSTATKTMPPLLFPWRHTTDLPPRLVERRKVHGNGLISYENGALGIATVTAAFHLDIPWYRLLGKRWRNELAESCSWAFVEGVACILSNTYHVPLEEIATYNDNNDVSIQFNYNLSKEEEGKASLEGDSGTKEAAMSENVDNLLFEARLSNLFRNAHKSGKDHLQVFLASTPTRADLHSLHALPAVSRNMAENHPRLMKEVLNARSKGSTRITREFYRQIVKENGKVETTLFAEVLIHCMEKFWVKDLHTGAIVQGHGDGEARPVVHALRLERVSTFEPKKGLRKGQTMENWMITDIDDLLGGNRWFTPTVRHWWLSG